MTQGEPPPLPRVPPPVAAMPVVPMPAVPMSAVPAVPVYTVATPAAGRKPFAVQAAMFSLYAVPAAILIHFLTAVAEPQVQVYVGAINLAVIGLGLLLGIAALVAMRRTGRRGVLGRAIVGLILNGLALSAVVVFSHSLSRLATGPDPTKLVGQWTRRVPTQDFGNVTDTITLDRDGTFHEIFHTNERAVVGDWSGTWKMDRRQLVVDVTRVDVGAEANRTGSYGTVRGVIDGDLVLLVNGNETRFHPGP